MVNEILEHKANEHEIIRNLNIVRAFWNDNSKEIIKPRLKYNSLPNNSIIMAPGSVWNTKRFPEEKWAELILQSLSRRLTLTSF